MSPEILQPEYRWLLSALVFLFGLCIGSFLNVVIYRLPLMLQREWHQDALFQLQLDDEIPTVPSPRFNLAFPPSACPGCGQKIQPWQNIPMVSYLFLLGRCHGCRQPISCRYPLVELATGVLSVVVLWQFGPSWQTVALLLLTYLSIAMVGIDADHHLLPDVLTLPLLWLGLLLNTGSLFVPLADAVWGAALGYGVLWSVFQVFRLATGKEGMGFGDFKLLAAFGAWFGWQILPGIILLSSLTGTLYGAYLMLHHKRDSQAPMPYGPFIAGAAWALALFPKELSWLMLSAPLAQ